MFAAVPDKPAREPSLDPVEDDRVRAVVRRMVTELGSQAAAARKIGYSQQSVSRHLDGVPAGKGLARAVAAAAGISFEELIGRGRIEREDRRPLLGNLPGWPEAEAKARVRYAKWGLPEEAWVGARGVGGFDEHIAVSPERVFSTAKFWLEMSEKPEQTDEARATERAEEARLEKLAAEVEAAKRRKK